MGSIVLEEISHYLLAKFSALLDEAEKDPTKLSCISRFRNAEYLIKSNYLHNNKNTASSEITPVSSTSSMDSDIRNLLYDLISALSDCRVFAQQHRGSVTPKNAFLQLKHFWFVGQTNRRLDELDKKLKAVLSRREFLIVAGLAPASNVVDDDGNDEDDEDGVDGFSGSFIGLDSAAEKVKEFIAGGGVNDASNILKGIGIVIVIVGVGGSGKTALARKVFDSLPVRNMFTPRIWVSLSGTLYDEPVSTDLRVKILKKMLEQAGCDVSELVTTYVGIPELTEKLYHRLMGKRYLIVLDEVWHVNDWYVDLGSELPKGDEFGDCISHALPKDSGGRIIVTSRRGGVAREVVGGDNLILIDTLLSEKMCWTVFSDAVHKDGKDELMDITLSNMEEQISKKCFGLPLAARTLAGILPEQIRQKQLN